MLKALRSKQPHGIVVVFSESIFEFSLPKGEDPAAPPTIEEERQCDLLDW